MTIISSRPIRSLLRWASDPCCTNLKPVSPGTEGAISLEGTLASAAGSIVMTLVCLSLQLLTTSSAAVLVTVVGLLATLAESLIGALLQEQTPWLTNELINGLQTLLAALLAMVAARLIFPVAG